MKITKNIFIFALFSLLIPTSPTGARGKRKSYSATGAKSPNSSPRSLYAHRVNRISRIMFTSLKSLGFLIRRTRAGEKLSEAKWNSVINSLRDRGRQISTVKPVPPAMSRAAFYYSTTNIALSDAMDLFDRYVDTRDIEYMEQAIVRLQDVATHIEAAGREVTHNS